MICFQIERQAAESLRQAAASTLEPRRRRRRRRQRDSSSSDTRLDFKRIHYDAELFVLISPTHRRRRHRHRSTTDGFPGTRLPRPLLPTADIKDISPSILVRYPEGRPPTLPIGHPRNSGHSELPCLQKSCYFHKLEAPSGYSLSGPNSNHNLIVTPTPS